MGASSIPMQVRIGRYVFQIHWMDTPIYDARVEDVDEAQVLNGQILCEECCIQMSTHLSPQMRPAILLHEIIHGCLWLCGYNDHDESMVQALGHMLTQVLRDNPDLVAYITADSTSDG